jgi:hypothetical protein
VARITSTDEGLRMPPADSGKSLTPREIDLLKQWVTAGAGYQKHWSLEPIARPPLPVVSRVDWVRNPIDAFVLAKLDQQGLAPSPEADRATLARRVALDVLGLPLEPAALERYLNDPDPLAYDALVDRLLASPQYGERMAMFWLDLVRYADSVGYHGDQAVSVSPYRDWVIAAFNANMPFDRFTREQLSGDLLAGATTEQKIASGYNRLGMMTAEGGAQDKEYLAKYAAERVRNLGGTWLGLTLGCCECRAYRSTDDVVGDAPRVLRDLTARREQLRADVQLGIDEAARGLAGPLDVEALIERCTERLAAESIAD